MGMSPISSRKIVPASASSKSPFLRSRASVNAPASWHLPEAIGGARVASARHLVLPDSGIRLDELECELICQALVRTDGNKTGAARLLGLSRDTLRYRLEKYGI